MEVIAQQQKVARWRNVVSYATMPIGFIPWIGTPLQKLIEEGVSRPLKKKLYEKHQWFYLLSDAKEDEALNQ